MKDAKLFASNEIYGAILTNRMPRSDIEPFKADPKGFTLQATNVDLGSADVNVVENDQNTIHLALPYYSVLDEARREMIKNEDLENISGGEIFISAIIVLTTTAAIGAVGCLAVSGMEIDKEMKRQKKEGGGLKRDPRQIGQVIK